MSNKKQKRANAKSSAKQKELKKDLSAVRGQLTRGEEKLTKALERAERWKKEAKAHKRSASRAEARAERLHQKLSRATTALAPTHALAPMEAAASGQSVTEPATAEGVTQPDGTWSVVQLRAEARARGLAGLSNKSKAQLIDALT